MTTDGMSHSGNDPAAAVCPRGVKSYALPLSCHVLCALKKFELHACMYQTCVCYAVKPAADLCDGALGATVPGADGDQHMTTIRFASRRSRPDAALPGRAERAPSNLERRPGAEAPPERCVPAQATR